MSAYGNSLQFKMFDALMNNKNKNLNYRKKKYLGFHVNMKCKHVFFRKHVYISSICLSLVIYLVLENAFKEYVGLYVCVCVCVCKGVTAFIFQIR